MGLLTRWFRESASAGHAVEWRVQRTLFSGRSSFQTIEVLELESFGTALILDGIMQTTTGDEYIYHEMLAHVPLCAHPHPQRVLIVGGGDGGLAREVLRHHSVEQLVMVEIDRMVVEVATKYLPEHTTALGDSRLVIHYADGSEFLHDPENHGQFDVVLVDSTDPEGDGPGNWLYTDQFHDDVLRSLRPHGIFVQQTGTPFFNPEVVERVSAGLNRRFPWTGTYWSVVPTYPGGFFTFSAGSLGPNVSQAIRVPSWETRWYTEGMHALAFSLPASLARTLRRDEAPADPRLATGTPASS